MQEKVQAFIAYVQEKNQQLVEAFHRSNSIFLYNPNSSFVSLQEEIEKKAKDLGIYCIYVESEGFLKILMCLTTFYSMNFSDVEETQIIQDGEIGVTWVHFKALLDGHTYTACKKQQ